MVGIDEIPLFLGATRKTSRADLVLQVRQDLKVLRRVGDVSFGGKHGSQQVVLDEK